MGHLTICLYTLSDQYDNLWTLCCFVEQENVGGGGGNCPHRSINFAVSPVLSRMLPSLTVEAASVSRLPNLIRKFTSSYPVTVVIWRRNAQRGNNKLTHRFRSVGPLVGLKRTTTFLQRSRLLHAAQELSVTLFTEDWTTFVWRVSKSEVFSNHLILNNVCFYPVRRLIPVATKYLLWLDPILSIWSSSRPQLSSSGFILILSSPLPPLARFLYVLYSSQICVYIFCVPRSCDTLLLYPD